MKKLLLALICAAGFVRPVFAFQDYVVDGTTYAFPDVDDQEWGQDVTDWAGAVTNAVTRNTTLLQAATSSILAGGATAYAPALATAQSTATAKTRMDALAVDTTTLASTKLSSGSQTVNSYHLSVTGVSTGIYSNPQLTIGGDGRIIAAISQSGSTTSAAIGLVITTGATNTTQSSMTATGIDVMGSFFAYVSTQADITKSGAGGLDTGSKANSTGYDLYAISDTTGSRFGMVFSSAGKNQPTLPSGYTKWRKIGWIYVNSSGNLVPMLKRGSQVFFFTSQVVLTSAPVGTAAVWTPIPLGNVVSPYATSVTCSIKTAVAAAVGNRVFVKSGGNVTGGSSNEYFFGYYDNNSSAKESFYGGVAFALGDPKQIEYNASQPNENLTALMITVISYQEEL